jgi:hypothetical protein
MVDIFSQRFRTVVFKNILASRDGIFKGKLFNKGIFRLLDPKQILSCLRQVANERIVQLLCSLQHFSEVTGGGQFRGQFYPGGQAFLTDLSQEARGKEHLDLQGVIRWFA